MLKAAVFGFAATILVAGTAEASVLISTAKTQNMNCSAGVCSPTAANAVLNRRDLGVMLRASDVKVTSGAGAVTIAIMSPLTWANAHRLTLDAQHSVAIRSTVVVKGTGGLTITLEDGVAGAFNFYPGGSITFWDTASSFIVNGKTYTLVNDIATLAADIASNQAGFYALAKDYDASVDGTYSTSPIQAVLTGTVEGLGHVISNLSIDLPSGQTAGLFFTLAGTVQDLSVTNAIVSCEQIYQCVVGVLAGQALGKINNSFVSGSIGWASEAGGLVGVNGGTINQSRADVWSGGTIAGGLAGFNGGTISNSSATGSVGGGYAGGLVGMNDSIISNSQATGSVDGSGGDATGGLVGKTEFGSITRSYATGRVYGKHYAGGLIGQDEVTNVDSCFATGTVSGEQFVGGLVGWIHNNYSANPQVTNSYATGAVTGGAGADVGAFLGQSDTGSIQVAFATGLVSGGRDAGGFVGGIGGFQYAYWDLDTTGIDDPHRGSGNRKDYSGITGLTDAQLKSGLPAGLDPKIWGQSAGINNGYPYLLAVPPPR